MPLDMPNTRNPIFSRPQPVEPEQTVPPSTADIIYLSDLQPQPVDWLWQHRLACGTLAMISGQPGAGKTFLALSIAAALSRGYTPYSGEKLEPCTVLYASAEHAAAEVLHPRFAALNGDPGRLVVLRGTANPAHPIHPHSLEEALQRTHARLLILDPLQTYFGPGVNLDQLGEALPLLDHLARLAKHHHCCILLLRHLGKRGPGRPPQHGHGLSEFFRALRTAFLAGASPDAPANPALLPIKSNLGPLADALAYTIDPTDGFLWTGPSKLTSEELLADRPTGAGLPKRRFAGEWLREYLQNGAQSQYTIETAAQRDGVCIATLKRAKFDLGVLSTKDGQTGPWVWSLPIDAAN